MRMLEAVAISEKSSRQSEAKNNVSPKTKGEAIERLKERIDTIEDNQEKRQLKNKRAELPAEAAALIGRIATEMVAGLMVGGFMGWMLDRLLGTTPLFMIVLFFLGAAAGMMNIWRMAKGHGLKVGYFDRKTDSSDGNDRTG
jgi:ATP synthase protein I